MQIDALSHEQVYLVRPRLLSLLPQEPGQVIWLEAPSGYGKTILAEQWAQRMIKHGYSCFYLSLAGRDPCKQLAKALNLPSDTPLGAVLDLLHRQPNLLIFDDVKGSEDLNSFLKYSQTLTLLISRSRLTYPALLALITQGRLYKLSTQDLAFNYDEASELVKDPKRLELLWQETKGWPLPFHLGSLNAKQPDHLELVKCLKESVDASSWQEALLLAALPCLPFKSHNAETKALFKAGFVQELKDGYKLHSLLAQALLKAYKAEVRSQVMTNLQRLPLVLQGMAFEATDLYEALEHLLSEHSEDLSRYEPEAVLRWDGLLTKPRSSKRKVRVGWSLWATGQQTKAVEVLLSAASESGSADERLLLYKDLIWVLAQRQDIKRATEILNLGEPLVSEASPELSGRFLHNSFLLFFNQGDWSKAEVQLNKALSHYPENSSFKQLSLGNKAIVRWHSQGLFGDILTERARLLATNKALNPSNVAGDLLQLAELHVFLDDRQKALALLTELDRWQDASPRWSLEALALQAYLTQELERFGDLFERAKAWDDPLLNDRILFFWSRAARETHKPPPQAEESGKWFSLEKALHASALGDNQTALRLLGKKPPASETMEYRLYWYGAHICISHDPHILAELVNMSEIGAQILPALVPLESLPPGAAEATKAYPLNQVLRSQWAEAIELRMSELPRLELNLLGRFEVKVLGKEVTLTERQKQILSLLLSQHSRDVIAEALWPESSSKNVLNNLNVQFNLLRKTLEPWGKSSYLFEDGLRHVVSDYLQLLDALNHPHAQTVVDLYHEPFAPGVTLGLIENLREQLRQRVLSYLLKYAKQETTLTLLARILELEPLHEEALQLLLERLLASGRRREAQRRYYQFQRTLEELYGQSPLAETTALLSFKSSSLNDDLS